MCAEEAGRYLEMYKAFEQKPPDLIRTKVGNSYMSVLQSVLTNVRRVNKTDVLTMSTKYKSFATMVQQTSDQLVMLPGMGDTKAKNLARAFREPFLLQETTAPPKPALPPASKEHRREEPITFDSLPDNFESLPEEEQLRIAMQLSME
ncbi:ssDNA endonuclease and repair protein Rad10 [Malassezia pachydermatis]